MNLSLEPPPYARLGSRRPRPAAFAVLVAALLLVATSSISCTKITVAGVMVVFENDGTLDPDTLHATVTSDAGKTLLDWCYSIPSASQPPFFPTTLAIVSDGNPGASVTISASVLRAGVTLDVRQNLVTLVPTDHLVELPIVFSARCTAQVSLLTNPAHGKNCTSEVAASRCGADQTCDPTTGMCVSDVVIGTAQPPYSPLDAGATGRLGNDAGDAEAEGGGSSPSAEAANGEASNAEASTPDAAEAGLQVPVPHCAPGGPGLTNCGSNEESCCTNSEVTGGAFSRTYDLDPLLGGNSWVAPDGGATGLAAPATVSTFLLDKYDVTVGRFRQFVNAWNGAAGFTPPAGSGKHAHLNGGQGLVDVGAPADAGTVYETGWNASDSSSIAPTNANLACDPDYATWTAAAGNNENLPINCVSWLEAYAFCIWDGGGFLPSEAEWEYAAGGNQQFTYPWGSADPGTASQYAIYGCYYPLGLPGFKCSGVSNIAAVGTPPLGAGPFGQLDLAGEVYQWTLDWYANYGPGDDDGSIGQYLPGAPCTDCANLNESFGRVVRGGCFLEDESTLLAPFRNVLFPADQPNGNSARDFRVGVRCARSP